MTMPPRYSHGQRSRTGVRSQHDDDEFTEMTEGKHMDNFSRVDRPSSRSSRSRKDSRYSDDESDVSEVSDEHSDYDDHEDDASISDYEDEDEEEEAFDNRSMRSSGGQSIAAQSLARAINKTKNKGGSRLAIQASLAMQRRKKESPKLLKKLESQTLHDVDYSDGATELYKHIENHRWREATERCRNEPIETKIWVYRMDKRRKKFLWKMLPIHTAILYRAPVYVILDLLNANPEGPKACDDRKMLPIHMACRVICKEDVLRVLLKHSIETVVATDAKGRTPRDILVDDKRDQDSKVLKKVTERNKKNLLKVLKEFETIFSRMNSSTPSVAGSRWSRFGDDRSVSSGMIGDDRSISSRTLVRSANRPSSKGSVKSARSSSRGNRSDRSVSKSDRSVSRSERPGSRSSTRSSRERPGSKNSTRSSRERHASTGRAARGVPRPEDGMNKRAPRIPTAPPRGAPPRAHSASRGRVHEDDNMSVRSGRSRVSRTSRNVEAYDEDDNQSRRSRISKAARGYDDDSVAGSRRSVAVSRVVRKPRGVVEAAIEGDIEVAAVNPMGITEIRVEGEETEKEDASDDDASTVSEGSEEAINEDFPDGPLYDLWKDIEALYPVPGEAFDPKIIEEHEKKLNAKRIAREEAISKIKYYDPPKELQKLLIVIQSGGEASFGAKKKQKGKDARAPLPEKGAQRRVNALGALKALAKNTKNRLRLGRTKGVISCLLSVLRDEAATSIEKSRCSNTLMFLSVPSQNCEAIFHSDPSILRTLLHGMNDDDSQVNYNCCYSLFLLSKSDENRIEIAENGEIIKTLAEMSDIDVDDGPDDDDDGDFSVDGSLSQRFANLGSPSGIRQQGAPTTDEETKRGCRLSAMKVFLAISKSKDGAQKMLSNRSLMYLFTTIGGTLTAEENLLCMAIFTNMSRNAENMDSLFRVPNFIEAVTRGLSSKNAECRKCSTLTLQNLSCNKVFRRKIGTLGISLPGIASQGLKKSDGKIAKESHFAAIHTIRNLAVEPSNIPAMMGAPGLTAGLMIAAADREDELSQYIAGDALAAMSQWLDSVVDTCIERNEIDLKGKSLASMHVSTWNPWD